MVAFHNRRTATPPDRSGSLGEFITGITGRITVVTPMRKDDKKKYPVDQTASVTDMR